jgi:hypothetical protein
MNKVNIKSLLKVIKDFWLNYEAKIILVLGLILVSGISFEVGILKGQKSPESPLIIEKPVESNNLPANPENAQKTQNLTSGTVPAKIGEETPQNPKNCAFVGSKNSNKYYPPNCSFAKRIKPENIVCFKDDQDAQSKGYQKSTSCFK